MKKLLLLSAILLGATAASRAGVSVNFGFGIPLPPPPRIVISAPAPRYYVEPAPVYAPPCEEPVVTCPPPVVCAPPVVCEPRVDLRFRFGDHDRAPYWHHREVYREYERYHGHDYRERQSYHSSYHR